MRRGGWLGDVQYCTVPFRQGWELEQFWRTWGANTRLKIWTMSYNVVICGFWNHIYYRLYLLLLLYNGLWQHFANICKQGRLKKFPRRRLHLLQSSKISASSALRCNMMQCDETSYYIEHYSDLHVSWLFHRTNAIKTCAPWHLWIIANGNPIPGAHKRSRPSVHLYKLAIKSINEY